jgi:hypothetical protein
MVITKRDDNRSWLLVHWLPNNPINNRQDASGRVAGAQFHLVFANPVKNACEASA